MESNQKQEDEAFQLIDEFGAKLLKLSGGKKIPSHWKTRLVGVITPSLSTRGVKRKPVTEIEIVKQLTLNSKDVRRTRTKRHNPAVIKDEIAKNAGVSRKTVERLDNDRPVKIKDVATLDSLESNKRQVYIEGISAAAAERIQNNFDAHPEFKETEARLHHINPPDSEK